MAKAQRKATAPEWDEGTVYLKSTDEKGNISHTEHRCWHMGNFVKGAHKRATEAGGKVEQITEADYRRATKRR